MCREKDCDCLDEICCSIRTKALFYAYWTLVHYVLFFIWILVFMISKKPQYLYAEISVAISSLINRNGQITQAILYCRHKSGSRLHFSLVMDFYVVWNIQSEFYTNNYVMLGVHWVRTFVCIPTTKTLIRNRTFK